VCVCVCVCVCENLFYNFTLSFMRTEKFLVESIQNLKNHAKKL